MRRATKLTALTVAAVVGLGGLTGCGTDVIDNVSAIGAQGTGAGSYKLTAQIPSAAGLVTNAPVMMHDTTVGSIGSIEVKNWTALITLRLNEGVQVPEGSHAMIGMTSVLGSSHLAIVPPDKPNGRYLSAGGSLPLPNCPKQDDIAEPKGQAIPDINAARQVDPCRYPTTEEVLSSLSVVLNGGGLAQTGDIVHELSQVFGGREDVLKHLIPRVNTLVADLDKQTGNIITAMEGLSRLSAEINAQEPTVQRALAQGPQILQLLVDERKNLTTALDSVAHLSDTANQILRRNSDDLKSIVPDMRKLLGQLALTGPALTNSLRILLTFPFIEDTIDTVVKGDYVNSDLVLDLTFGRLSKSMMASIALTGPEGLLGMSAATARQSVDPLLAPLFPNGDAPSPNAPKKKPSSTAKPTSKKSATSAPNGGGR
ncbi:MAG: MlaD family protein [Gordonia sp. (in: high G+C Gram-positive bacteria)]